MQTIQAEDPCMSSTLDMHGARYVTDVTCFGSTEQTGDRDARCALRSAWLDALASALL